MARERLYIVYGTGPDRVGLVGAITTPIAKAGGNVVDLRQDVLHGLFTIFAVVDLSATALRTAELGKIVKDIAEDTGLDLRVDNYTPVARSPEKENMLMVLIGRDRPGIIASISEALGKYRINIERAQTVAREDVFLMELLSDVSHCALPLENARASLSRTMEQLGIATLYQSTDVFNKKKRVVLFDIRSSLLGTETLAEVLQQTGIPAAEAAQLYAGCGEGETLCRAARKLEGLPADVLSTVAASLGATPGTMELLQTLKTMGYATALAAPAFAPFMEALAKRLGLDRVFGVGLGIDNDSRVCTGAARLEDIADIERQRLLCTLAEIERVGQEDVTVVADAPDSTSPGIRLQVDLGVLLHLYNTKSLSKANMLGILGSLGMPGM